MTAPTAPDDLTQLRRLAEGVTALRTQVAERVVGQTEAVDGVLTAILGGGHALLVGVPGLAKTLLVSTVAEALNLSFNRVQFTPDLMPGDITGTELVEEDPATGKRHFRFVPGPIFAQVVLADEINRTPPKTQAALLQAMQERTVTVAGQTYPLPAPFFVLATQNPIEQEGTYPLPEAQLDRFMLELRLGYPSRSEEETIVAQTTGSRMPTVKPVFDGAELSAMQSLVRRIPVSQSLISAAVLLARMTRPNEAEAPPLVREYVEWGAGPRASQYLVLGAKARAAMDGRPQADLDDVKSVALAVLRHRVMTNFAAEAADRTSEDVVAELVGGGSWLPR
ncbi:MAG: AAA family ATPase [Gemmatimonadetes bacterium]|nr:AAA family ATPase [Gemmatimonadota bacterium]MBP6442453.1 AAA family ATPase [Gemmatimonadales bacterium]MBP6570246.1 AAA family ATPase [Gemmatimonadales bacterium]MBP7619581.1 AAA family ATPase [Gemmatimonadales bacterium]MBP9898604.1 AAA family ATPase [Gemmatimonadales bacterium]